MYGAPDRVRTYNLRIRSPLLYPVELRTHNRLLKHRVFKGIQINNMGWNTGLEPVTPGTTNQCSNQLS